MNILLLVKNFDLGGTEVHVRELANGLAKTGHTVFVMSRAGRQKEHLLPEVTFIEHRLSDLGLLRTVKFIRSLIKKHQIDILHGHQRLAILAATIAGALSKTPRLATIHGRIQLDARPAIIRRWINGFILVAPNRLAGLRKGSPVRDKCRVIYNGLIAFPKPTWRDPPSAPRILYASRIDSRHSQTIIAILQEIWPAILKEFPDARFEILGDGDHFDEVRAAAKPYLNPEKPSVVLHGFVPSLEPCLSKCSLTIGVGRVAIESLARGVPVIPANSAHQAPLVSRENYETIKADNFVGRPFFEFSAPRLLEELQQTLRRFPEHWNETRELVSDVHRDFSLDGMVFTIEKFYREEITSSTSSPAS